MLELVVKRGRALVDARVVLILLREGDDLVVAAAAGQVAADEHPRLPVAGSTAGEGIAEQRSRRVSDAAADLRVSPERLGVPGASNALLVPLVFRGASLGVLAAFDRLSGEAGFTGDEQQLLEAFAAQAATAVATARRVEADRLRRSFQAAEAERRRWSRELHDETLQALGSLKVLLSSASRLDDVDAMRRAMRAAIDQLQGDIGALRGLIAELRPPALDQLGLSPALGSLAQRTAIAAGLDVKTDLDLPDSPALGEETETTVYRVVQEALTNVVKHAGASAVVVSVRHADDEVRIEVRDNGRGFDPLAQTDGGFGLTSMRERLELSRGELSVEPAPDAGTIVRARLPLR